MNEILNKVWIIKWDRLEGESNIPDWEEQQERTQVWFIYV